MQAYFAAAISGTERVLCDELRELGFASARFNRGGIPFRDGWRACLQSRIAQRIQVLLHRFPAPTNDALYAGVRAVDWSPYLTSRQTFSVSAVCQASAIHHSGFAALKVKDAIVDQLREQFTHRPSVDRDDPDVRVHLYLANDKAALYLDLSGAPLHRRGYRRDTGEAPLRETLAAAVLRFSGWDRRTPLLDPMCGSGTIAIEAAMWAANLAPGLARERFGFERWANFGADQARELRELKGELRAAATAGAVRIVAADVDETVLEKARANARAAGVRLTFRHRSVLDLQADAAGPCTLVTNPPYGVRMEKDPEFCRHVAAVFSRLHGWRVCILAGTRDYERMISARPVCKIPLSSGDLACDLLVYDMP
jgi:putative N6-adenine-specific DNA methylase